MSVIDKFLNFTVDLESMSIAYHDKEVEDERCDETPIGAVIFASMGVDGVHYCVVPKEGRTIEESPVYVVSPSDGEDTVVWVAKDIIDFLSIGAAMGNFLYISHCHSCSKKEFGEILELSWEDGDESEKKAAISKLDSEFPLKKFDDVYKYIMATYKDKNNHTKLRFLSTDIRQAKLGHYNNE